MSKSDSSISRRRFGQLALAGAGSLLLSQLGCAGSGRRPNILLVLTDDQGYGDIASHGNKLLHTPWMDTLAKQGARLDNFFVSPVCTPTRASLLTGRYHLRTGCTWTTRGREAMRGSEVTMAEVFKKAGYHTGCFGKWHNGEHWPSHPNAQGFEEFIGFCAGVWSNYFDSEIERNNKPLKTKGYLPDVLTGRAIDFMKTHRDEPFLCYVPYNTPHTPVQVPDKYFDKYKAKGLDDRLAGIYGMIENVDDNLGRLLASLKELDLEDDTIVVFLSDNGPNGNRFNAGMRGKKGSLFDGGTRVPCFVRWPGKIKPGTLIEKNAAHIDMLPTLAAMCGVSLNGTPDLDGRDVSPLLHNKPVGWDDRIICTMPTWKSITPTTWCGAFTQQWRGVLRNDGWELYDIDADPGQQNNIAADHPEVLKKLTGEYGRVYKECAVNGFEPLPSEIGHPEDPVVFLPGNEAMLLPKKTKGIAYNYSSGWSNNWVAKWTDPKAYPEWKIKCVTPGKYRVSLKYLCAKEDAGCSFNMKVGSQRLETVIAQAHEPAPHTIPFRLESEKGKYGQYDFKEHLLGELHLEKGVMPVQLRVLRMAGNKAADIRGVTFEKL